MNSFLIDNLPTFQISWKYVHNFLNRSGNEQTDRQTTVKTVSPPTVAKVKKLLWQLSLSHFSAKCRLLVKENEQGTNVAADLCRRRLCHVRRQWPWCCVDIATPHRSRRDTGINSQLCCDSGYQMTKFWLQQTRSTLQSSDTPESFLSKVTFESDFRKKTF